MNTTKRPPDFDESDGLGLRLSPGGGSAMPPDYKRIQAERKASDKRLAKLCKLFLIAGARGDVRRCQVLVRMIAEQP